MSSPIHILFGTESGNAQGLAARAGEALTKAGLPNKVIDMMDFQGAKLPEVRRLLVITSTYGNGDPPSNAEALHAFLMKKCGPLPDTSFSVCALGDTTYDRFAQCGKDFDRRLEELGGKRVAPRKDCDVDYDDPFEAWLADAITAMKMLSERASEPSVEPAPAAPSVPPLAVDAPGTRRNPVMARVTANVDLVVPPNEPIDPAQRKETRHIELELLGPFAYELGDSIGIWPTNDPVLVADILRGRKARWVRASEDRGRGDPLASALATKLDVVQPDVRLLEKVYGALSSEERKARLAREHVIDVLADVKGGLGASELVSLLRPLAPRQYSIASTPRANPRALHLTVAVVRYERNGRPRGGVASIQLADRAPPGAELPIYLHPSPKFRLAPPDTDIVMIGPGTGIAPFRAFLADRAITKGKGRSWLFFGARHRAQDWLYREDLERFQRDGVLHELDVAFSRDQPEKVYVQHKMLARAKELWSWLEGGAVLYVCGDAQRMAVDVHAALATILEKEGGMSNLAARAKLDAWMDAGKYRKDVY
ncbi:MAG: flavodoxin domain-containing protein [Polyangiaceae bacterium]